MTTKSSEFSLPPLILRTLYDAFDEDCELILMPEKQLSKFSTFTGIFGFDLHVT